MQPTLIYDGQCGLCTALARRLQRLAGQERLKIVPLDAPGAMELHPGLSYSRAIVAVQLILANGYLCEGAEAGANALGQVRGLGWLPFLYYLPPFRQLSNLFYRLLTWRRRRCAACP